MTGQARKLVAVAEAVAPWLDDEQATRALSFLMALAGEGSDRVRDERNRREKERRHEERALARAGDVAASARRAREPA